MRRHRIVLILSFVFFLASGGAFAQEEPGPLDPDNNPPPCWDNPDNCVGGDGGTAPGMTSCTSNEGCKECFLDDETQEYRCGTTWMRDGVCKCERIEVSGTRQCKMEGTCTYRA